MSLYPADHSGALTLHRLSHLAAGALWDWRPLLSAELTLQPGALLRVEPAGQPLARLIPTLPCPQPQLSALQLILLSI